MGTHETPPTPRMTWLPAGHMGTHETPPTARMTRLSAARRGAPKAPWAACMTRESDCEEQDKSREDHTRETFHIRFPLDLPCDCSRYTGERLFITI